MHILEAKCQGCQLSGVNCRGVNCRPPIFVSTLAVAKAHAPQIRAAGCLAELDLEQSSRHDNVNGAIGAFWNKRHWRLMALIPKTSIRGLKINIALLAPLAQISALMALIGAKFISGRGTKHWWRLKIGANIGADGAYFFVSWSWSQKLITNVPFTFHFLWSGINQKVDVPRLWNVPHN